MRHQVVLIGTRMNGEKCHKGHALRATRDDPRRGQKAGDWYSNHATLDGLPECDDGFDRDYSEPRYGLIPYSDETLERLEQIQERLTELRKQVEAMITGPDSAAIVQAIMTTNLLPAPKEKA